MSSVDNTMFREINEINGWQKANIGYKSPNRYIHGFGFILTYLVFGLRTPKIYSKFKVIQYKLRDRMFKGLNEKIYNKTPIKVGLKMHIELG